AQPAKAAKAPLYRRSSLVLTRSSEFRAPFAQSAKACSSAAKVPRRHLREALVSMAHLPGLAPHDPTDFRAARNTQQPAVLFKDGYNPPGRFRITQWLRATLIDVRQTDAVLVTEIGEQVFGQQHVRRRRIGTKQATRFSQVKLHEEERPVEC